MNGLININILNKVSTLNYRLETLYKCQNEIKEHDRIELRTYNMCICLDESIEMKILIIKLIEETKNKLIIEINELNKELIKCLNQ